MTPEISIIAPVYNVEKYLNEFIESILEQSFTHFELILIDDCSTDHSLDVINNFMQKDTRIKVIAHEQNRGTFKTRETGYSNAQGNYIVFCDSDDCLAKDALKNLHDEIIKTDADIVISNMVTKTNGQIEDYLVQNDIQEGIYSSEEICKFLLQGKMLHALHSKIFKASLFKQLRAFPEIGHFCNYEDEYFYYNILQEAKKISYINKKTYIYNIHEGSSSQKGISDKILESICSAINERVRLFRNNKQIWPVAKRSCSNDALWLVYTMHCDQQKVLHHLNFKEADSYFKWHHFFFLKLRLRLKSRLAALKS